MKTTEINGTDETRGQRQTLMPRILHGRLRYRDKTQKELAYSQPDDALDSGKHQVPRTTPRSTDARNAHRRKL